MKICIVNAHWSNRGDEAALRALLNKLLNEYGDCEIRVIFKDSSEVRQFPYAGRISYFSAKFLPRNLGQMTLAVMAKGRWLKPSPMKAEIEAVCGSDVIIYSPGGSVISDRFWWRKQQEYLLPFLCAKLYRIPILVAAPSMGPFENRIWRNLIRKWLLGEARKIYVREKISENYLNGIGVCKNVVTTIDTAFYDAPDERENRQIWERDSQLQAFVGRGYSRIIGMTLSDFSWHVEYAKKAEQIQHVENIMRDFIKARNKEGIGVILIPQLFGNQNDEEYLKKFSYENTFILSDEMDTYFQQFLISQLYAHIGMRYHSNIFAAKAGVPFIAVAYEEKMQGFMEMCGLDDYAIRLDELSGDVLEDKWRSLKKNYGAYQKQLDSCRVRCRQKAEITVRGICEEIRR